MCFVFLQLQNSYNPVHNLKKKRQLKNPLRVLPWIPTKLVRQPWQVQKVQKTSTGKHTHPLGNFSFLHRHQGHCLCSRWQTLQRDLMQRVKLQRQTNSILCMQGMLITHYHHALCSVSPVIVQAKKTYWQNQRQISIHYFILKYTDQPQH